MTLNTDDLRYLAVCRHRSNWEPGQLDPTARWFVLDTETGHEAPVADGPAASLAVRARNASHLGLHL